MTNALDSEEHYPSELLNYSLDFANDMNNSSLFRPDILLKINLNYQ